MQPIAIPNTSHFLKKKNIICIVWKIYSIDLLFGKKKLKLNIIKRYLVKLQSVCLDYKLDKAKVEIYNYSILQKIITNLRKLYDQRNIYKYWPIFCNILFNFILKFNQIILKKANLYYFFHLVFIEFLQINKFTYNKIKRDFSF